MKYILLTGGNGYIGMHTAVELINNGYKNIIILDNLSNSTLRTDIVKYYTGIKPIFIQNDIRGDLNGVFVKYNIHCVIHFAGLKSVSDSIKYPREYYDVNVSGTINILNYMSKYSVYNLIFSSSATVYAGTPPFKESDKNLGAINPYGRSKLMIENILKDMCASNDKWNILVLRYFNPVGCLKGLHENPKNPPNNLVPVITRCLTNNKKLNIFGNDYDTKDGTCLRDFIHVQDVAAAHVKSYVYMTSTGHVKSKNYDVFNIGTGRPYSVLEIVKCIKSTKKGKHLEYVFTQKRQGDVMSSYADVSKIYNTIGWKSKFGLKQICDDSCSHLL
jgi:UDP-glucose 4-epimerase